MTSYSLCAFSKQKESTVSKQLFSIPFYFLFLYFIVLLNICVDLTQCACTQSLDSHRSMEQELALPTYNTYD